MSFICLPITVLEVLLEYLPIWDCSRAICVFGSHLDDNDRGSLLRQRKDPRKLLKQLVSDPDDLLKSMLVCRAGLSGSRGTEYFRPGTCTAESDWDFYCSPDHLSMVRFSLHLARMGVVWKAHPLNSSSTDEEPEEPYPDDTTSMIRGTIKVGGRDITVQLMYSLNRIDGILPSVLKFHSSIVQCFVTGFGAVCMYNSLTSKGYSLHWLNKSHFTTERNSSHARSIELHENAMEKYQDRGIQYVSYDHYARSTRGRGIYGGQVVVQTRRLRGISRSIGDFDCTFTGFSRYYNDAVLRKKCEAMYRIYLKFNWLEFPYVCKFRMAGGIDTSINTSDILAEDDEAQKEFMETWVGSQITDRRATLVDDNGEPAFPLPHIPNAHLIAAASDRMHVEPDPFGAFRRRWVPPC